ncbi:MAG: acyl-CoA dehydratase activase-related protein [Heliobacteriaceae bacterium]|nr:acyl-CoA dehydratase activase-related protein [Heliobacteriaceae bacterium]MDD4587308.1 acyl-CoA dehydratase activase-related protein [Heliobacteriaceae bacterium]
MKITFPHMGNTAIVLKALFGELGLTFVPPPPITKHTLSLGVQHSPEAACLPLKINMGNFIEAIELGADTIVMAGGVGPCRFGYYHQVQNEILKDLYCEVKMVVLEPPDNHIGEFFARMRLLTGTNSWWRLLKAMRFAFEKCVALDMLEQEASYLRCRELKRGQVDRVYRKACQGIDLASTIKDVRWCRDEFMEEMRALPLDWQKQPVKIGLTGEIYSLLEPYASGHMEKHLGHLGAEVRRSLYLHEWINEHLFMGLLRVRTHHQARKLAVPYLSCQVGGHGQEAIGSTLEFIRNGFDGVIKVAPLTCMPEIVAQAILPWVEKDHGIPVMTIYMDEQTGEAGLLTRLEAFVDMLERKKRAGCSKWG